jgi:hypothetical protein
MGTQRKNNLGEKTRKLTTHILHLGAAVCRKQIAVIIATLLPPSSVHLGDALSSSDGGFLALK